jgi:hypothetical protein
MIEQINRAIERADERKIKLFTLFLMGWLETAEKHNKIHANTLEGIQNAAEVAHLAERKKEAA